MESLDFYNDQIKITKQLAKEADDKLMKAIGNNSDALTIHICYTRLQAYKHYLKECASNIEVLLEDPIYIS